MSWRHGLFSLWLVGTAIWMVGWTITLNMNCHLMPNGKLACRIELDSWIADLIDRNTWSFFKLGLLGFSIPAAVLVVGIVTAWATSRRR